MKVKWLGQSKVIRGLLVVFYTLLIFLFLVEIFIQKYVELFLEGYAFFYPVYGFLSCILVFIAAKIVSKIFKRDPDYYEQ
jgi:hypothetical protein